MYQDKKSNKVVIKKGFMKFGEFWREFSTLPIEIDRVAHFRIATSGQIDEGCCHPFPLTEDMDEMRKESTETDTAVAHNGIIKWTEPKGGLKAIYSDTMIFISEYLNKCKPLLFESAFGEIIEEATNLSRFVIMDIEKVAMIGYFELHHNIYYSNDSYAPLWSVLLGDYKESKYKSDAELDFNHISSYRIAFKTLSPVWSTANFICDLLEKKGAIVDDFWPAKDCIIIDVDVLPKFATFYGFEWFKVPKDEEEEEEYSEANTLDDDDCDGEYSDDCVKINCKFIDLCKERCEKEKEERYAG